MRAQLCSGAKPLAKNHGFTLAWFLRTLLARQLLSGVDTMQQENPELSDEPTEDSLITVAKWGFYGRIIVAAATVAAGLLAAIAAYYGA